MGKVDSTQLRYIRSKKLDLIQLYVVSLPYKIEIKGNPVFDGKKWTLFFTLLAGEILKEVPSGDIDRG